VILKWSDYERVYRVVNSVIENEGADPSEACIFFSAYGSYILSKHYGLDASPKAGLAAYRIGQGDEVLAFGEILNGELTGEEDAFHCWVEVNDWVIDFMAPAFSLLPHKKFSIPAKMFQKPFSKMAPSLKELNEPGDFFLSSTPKSTQKHMSVLSTSMAYGDLAEICATWFTKPPKKIEREIQIGNAKGSLNSVRLTGQRLVGTW